MYGMALELLTIPQRKDYHAIEKIENVGRLQFTQEDEKCNWIKKQRKLLLDDKVEMVITNLERLRSRNKEVVQAKQSTIHYYTEHEDRMRYKTYCNKGLLIGSGPIEAAHRNVIQQRLKLSGQKWSIKGAQAIANLRCYKKSSAWNIIDNLIRLAA